MPQKVKLTVSLCQYADAAHPQPPTLLPFASTASQRLGDTKFSPGLHSMVLLVQQQAQAQQAAFENYVRRCEQHPL